MTTELMTRDENVRTLPGLSHVAFQHPLDVQARAVLEKVPLLPQIVKRLANVFEERAYHIHFMSRSTRVNARQYPSLYARYLKLAQVLDIHRLPELYIDTTHEINAYAIGVDSYFIVLKSGLIDLMDEEELTAIIGHELGHVKCDHMLYTTMASYIREFGAALLEQFIPGVGGVASLGIQLSLLEWSRKAEFSADRAALLSTQNPDAVCSALAKLAGYSKHLPDAFDVEAVKEQAGAYEEIGADSMLDKMIRLYLLLGETHPYPAVRVREIDNWARSDHYARILAGDYKALAIAAADPRRPALPPLATATGLQCTKCGTAWPEGTSFCGKDGTNLKLMGATPICGQCRKPIESGWSICAHCGHGLQRIAA